MESVAELRRRLCAEMNSGRFYLLKSEFATMEPSRVFHMLFPIAIEFNGDVADQVAARLLALLEPACPCSCRESLVAIALAEWNLSDKMIPFYLISQFGKAKVHRVVNELVAQPGLSGSQITAVTGVAYWASIPLAQLVEDLLGWKRQYDSLPRN